MTKTVLRSAMTMMLIIKMLSRSVSAAEDPVAEDWYPSYVSDGRCHEHTPPIKGAFVHSFGRLEFPYSVKDPAVRVGEQPIILLQKAHDWPVKCSHSEGSWYEILRSRELLRCDPRHTLELAEQARGYLPKSAWIATIRARLLGTVASAQEAVQLDPTLMPARIALAAALIDERRMGEAQMILQRIDAAEVCEVHTLRARMRVVRHDPKGAMKEIRPCRLQWIGLLAVSAEPNAGLIWPWYIDDLEALAYAQQDGLSKKNRGVSEHVGTSLELREDFANHTKASEKIFRVMKHEVENPRESAASVDEYSAIIRLARLYVLAKDPQSARAIVTATPERQKAFCAGLPELSWALSAGDTRPTPELDSIRPLCAPQGPGSRPLGEPEACARP